MDICAANKKLSVSVNNFLLNVGAVKEESITDYLLWQWHAVDQNFKYLKAEPFTRLEESEITGADFGLELWLVGRSTHLSLVIQAKKFVKRYGSYLGKLRYPGNTGRQLNALLSYAGKHRHTPLCFIYTTPESISILRCGGSAIDDGVFIADAKAIRVFANAGNGSRISRDMILSECYPLHCLFCCYLLSTKCGSAESCQDGGIMTDAKSNSEPPKHVQMLLEKQQSAPGNSVLEIIPSSQMGLFRRLGVYDMRDVG